MAGLSKKQREKFSEIVDRARAMLEEVRDDIQVVIDDMPAETDRQIEKLEAVQQIFDHCQNAVDAADEAFGSLVEAE